MPVYRGRFAPSPTGLLHFGSLFAAVISYLEARSNNGEWLIRIEDIDPLREQTGAAEAILRSLAIHGLISDQPVVYQSARSSLYEDTLTRLYDKGFLFLCPCSRKYLLEHQGRHRKSCREQSHSDTQNAAYKFKAHQHEFYWLDQFLGPMQTTLNEDFVVKRREGFFAYQLAVVCDDIDQHITHVIRGYDLLDSTPMQLALYKALDQKAPAFGHFPVITNHTGQKLSKQNHSPVINDQTPVENLLAVFQLAGIHIHPTPVSCQQALELALPLWNKALLSGKRELLES